MSILHKWATGNHEKDNTANDANGQAVKQASGDFAYELANTEPTDAAYVAEKAKQYTATATKNLGATTKTDGTSVIDVKKIGWYNIVRMLRWRKIHKRNNKYGAALYKA